MTFTLPSPHGPTPRERRQPTRERLVPTPGCLERSPKRPSFGSERLTTGPALVRSAAVQVTALFMRTSDACVLSLRHFTTRGQPANTAKTARVPAHRVTVARRCARTCGRRALANVAHGTPRQRSVEQEIAAAVQFIVCRGNPTESV
jgi:hypothetical protein